MRFRQIILEYIDYKNELFLQRWEQETDAFGTKKYVDEIGDNGERWTDWLAKYDPTQNNKYVNWMITRYLKGGIQRLEDIPVKAAKTLDTYARLARKKKLEQYRLDLGGK